MSRAGRRHELDGFTPVRIPCVCFSVLEQGRRFGPSAIECNSYQVVGFKCSAMEKIFYVSL